MNRRNLFKGLLATVATIICKPFAKAEPKKYIMGVDTGLKSEPVVKPLEWVEGEDGKLFFNGKYVGRGQMIMESTPTGKGLGYFNQMYYGIKTKDEIRQDMKNDWISSNSIDEPHFEGRK